MTDNNPYAPPNKATPFPSKPRADPINWRILILAVLISFGFTFILGAGLGITFFAIAYAIGPSFTTYVNSTAFNIFGFAIGLIPEAGGAFYLGRNIMSRWFTHGVIYAMSNFLIACLFMLIPSESGITWADIGFCVLLIPIAIVFTWIATRTR